MGGSDDTAGAHGQCKHYQRPVGQMMQVQAFYNDQESKLLVAKKSGKWIDVVGKHVKNSQHKPVNYVEMASSMALNNMADSANYVEMMYCELQYSSRNVAGQV